MRIPAWGGAELYEVNHEPYLLDNIMLLSPLTMDDWSIGGGFLTMKFDEKINEFKNLLVNKEFLGVALLFLDRVVLTRVMPPYWSI